MVLESHKLSPTKWLIHFNELHISQPEDVKNHKGSVKAYKALLHHCTTNEEKLSIQHLFSIPDEKLQVENPELQNSEHKKKEFIKFLEVLGLIQHYPKKLKMKDAMLIRKETLDNNKYTDQIEVLPYLIIQKVFMFDRRSRAQLFKPNNSSPIKKIHPHDSFLALLHCCDNFLCQELLLKLSVCQMAIPILLPNPHDGSVMFLLWAMRSIIKSWKSNIKGVTVSKECRIIEYPAPVISFLKLGNPNKNITKSMIINEAISESKEDFFLNWNSEGGSTKRSFVDGLCEMCCYLPSGKGNVDDFYSDILLFLNIHGDAQNHIKQTQFIRKVSYMVFVLVNEDDINENSLKLLAKFSKIPGGVVLMFADIESEQAFKSSETEQSLSGMSIIKLVGKNNDEIRIEIRDNILTKLSLPAVEHCKRLIDCIDIAHKLQINVDEDDKECMQGRDLAQNMMKSVKLVDITKAKAEMLPLQGPSLWHTWAKLDKESFRHLSREEDTDMKSYSKQMDTKKEAIRNTQCQLSKNSTLIMKDFLANVSQHKGNIRLYFLQWLKMFLDDYSREKLPDLSARYHETREKLLKATEANKESQTESEEVKVLRKQLKDQNDELINASFGLEHLFREMGQVYEARMDPQLKVSQYLKNAVKSYPQIIIELMEDGFPVELMDGDAAHVPKSWILAVIQQLKEKHVQSSKIFVISVLGIQSTGKSTLLNTVFGLHFNVSAGRCTRGAYFQLLTLNETLRVQTNFHHILIVDTEGLRAPELQYKESQKHDNELATFVIGVADLTIINIYGETPGDLSDILETAVHAFIRMKQVDMQLSCHFVHQNVPAIMAEKKGKFGRQQFQDKLDLMTKTAAVGEHLVGCRFFRDVIQFDSETDIMYFPSLWKGDPPMAPVNQGYSDKAFSLKKSLITLAENKKPHCSFDKFYMRVNKLWEAILREKFVFSFKNTLEVIAYNELDTQYSQWSWVLKHKMLTWQNESTNIINSCEPSKLQETIDSSLKKAADELNTIYLEITSKIKIFFETSDKADTLAQWRKRTETRLDHLLEEHKEAAKRHCEVLKCSREGRVQVDEIQKNYRQQLHECITEITLNAKKEKYSSKQRKELFNTQWNKWITKLTKFEITELYASEDHIYSTITNILESIFPAHKQLILEKLKSKPLSNRGHILQLSIQKTIHLFPKALLKKFFNVVNDDDVREAKIKTEEFLHGAREQIEEVVYTLQNYDSKVVDQILSNLVEAIRNQNEIASYTFTPQYSVDISIVVAGYAANEMIKLVNKLCDQNSPVQALNKLKPIFFRTFESQFSAASNDKTAADNLSQLLATPIRTALIKGLRIEIINSMKDKPHFQKKNYFKAQVLENLAEKNEFELYRIFLTDVSESFKYWAQFYVEKYCKEKRINNENETNLTYLAKLQLGTIISNLTDAVNELEKKYVHTSEINDDVDTNTGIATSDIAASDTSTISGDHDDDDDDNDDDDDDDDQEQNNVDEEGGVCINLWLVEFLEKVKKTLTIDLEQLQEMIGTKKLKDTKLFTKRFIFNLKKAQEDTVKETEKQNSELANISKWDQPPHVLLSSTLTGCKESCPFCREQCECTDENHISEDGNCHFTNLHRPECLGRITWVGSGKLALEICSESIESDAKFRSSETKGEFIPYKKYKDIYPKWLISNEKPKDGQTYWQWFCAKYNNDIVKWVGATPTTVDSGWKKITKEEAIHSLSLTYGAKTNTDAVRS